MSIHYCGTGSVQSVTINGNPVSIIDLYSQWTQCCICGIDCPSTHGIPVDSETAEIVSNDFDGDWGGKPACESCHDRHAAGEFVGMYPRY